MQYNDVIEEILMLVVSSW